MTLEVVARMRKSEGRKPKVVMGVKGRGEVGKDGEERVRAVAVHELQQ